MTGPIACWKCGASEPAAHFGHHGDGSRRLYCDDCHLAQRRANHAKAKERRNALRRVRYARNTNGCQDKARAANKARYAREGNSGLKQWAKDNPDRHREAMRNKHRRFGKALTDYYVRRLLVQHSENLSSSMIPDALVKLKREQIRLERATRNENSE